MKKHKRENPLVDQNIEKNVDPFIEMPPGFIKKRTREKGLER